MSSVRKAVFPVAGLGTRFLPATKASPKEMLPIVDKPLIQYAVEEAAAAGITEMIFVTGRGKRSIEDHFDRAAELESNLASHGKQEALDALHAIMPPGVSFSYIRQSEPLGLGHAVLCARPLVQDEPFAVLLADDLIHAENPVLNQMTSLFERQQSSIISVMHVEPEETRQYGIVDATGVGIHMHAINSIVEKPPLGQAPSNLAVVGRYVFTPAIFRHLEGIAPDGGGEIQLTRAIDSLLTEENAFAYEFSGTRYDCGSKLGYLKATIAYGMRHPEVGEAFTAHLMETWEEVRSVAMKSAKSLRA
ncbi:MAG: UTP--glucose-1-phosphate uridylyltransferase GalU [Betaproteobacteria bacterium]